MTERPFIVAGGGGHARVVASMLRRLGKTILGYTDPDSDTALGSGTEHLGGDEVLTNYAVSDVALAVGIGSVQDATFRARLFEELRDKGYPFPSIVHPNAFVAPEARIETGVQVMAGAVIQAGATLAENVIINTNATIDHDCKVSSHVHIAPGATVSGNVSLGTGAHVGTGASVMQGVHIGSRSVVGAGAVVLNDVSEETVVVGVPAHSK